jgi:hypothetical protein
MVEEMTTVTNTRWRIAKGLSRAGAGRRQGGEAALSVAVRGISQGSGSTISSLRTQSARRSGRSSASRGRR